MATVIARAEIHRTVKAGKAATPTSPAVRPEIEVIKPGTRFVADGQFLADLIKGRAVEVVEETAPAGEAIAATPAAADSKPETGKKTTTQRTSKPKPAPAPAEPEKTEADGNGSESTDGNGDGDDGADSDLV